MPSAAAAQSSAETDRQVWQPVAKSVVDHDIVAMGRVYHPAAVLVSQKGATPIADALVRRGRDMVTAGADGDSHFLGRLAHVRILLRRDWRRFPDGRAGAVTASCR